MTDISRAVRRRREAPQNLPQHAQETELVVVDTTWGTVQPLEPVPGVATVGELEVIALVREGALLVDTRVPDSRSGATLPGAVNLAHDAIAERSSELGPGISVLFCNGPQCPQTPDALRILVDRGVAVSTLRYYRGGMHDWMTLGYPTQAV
jgi:rhodanese-related sulfurtransferase